MTTTSSGQVEPGTDGADGFEARFLSGRELYGDDFTGDEIARWFADEEHGYAELYGSDPERHDYGYGALNEYLGFRHLPTERRFRHALGFGSNFGDELLPVLDQVDRVTLLDSSDRYVVGRLAGLQVRYLLAEPSGRIRLGDASVDLITCFGVLHHIPNVSKVIDEFSRVLAPDGLLLLREPTTSLGDWRQPRVGLTPRERGIPRATLASMIESSGLQIVRSAQFYFPPWVRLCEKLRKPVYSSWASTAFDHWLARASSWMYSYHRRRLIAKFAPAGLFIVARRPVPGEVGPSTPAMGWAA